MQTQEQTGETQALTANDIRVLVSQLNEAIQRLDMANTGFREFYVVLAMVKGRYGLALK